MTLFFLLYVDFAYQRIDMNPFLLFPRSGSQSYLHFSSPGGGHKRKRSKKCSLPLRADGGSRDEGNNGAGGVP